EIPHVEHGRIAVCGCQASFRIDDSTVVKEYSVPDLPPPESIGRYRVVRYVGRGAANCVYEAIHPDLGVRVALKTLHPEYAGDKPSRESFANGAKVYAKAVHPNIVKVYESDRTADGVPFLAMEFLSGGSLADRLIEGKAFSPKEAAEIGAEICRALIVTAELGIVHRDIKPDNIMISGDGHFKLTDLGLAKINASSDQGNEACVLDENEEARPNRKTGFGTLEYMSPEQHLDAETCDIRSDIYSLGVTMYQLAAGRLPFETRTRAELRHMHLTVEPLVPSTYAPGIPLEFDYIVMRCIQKRPEDRYQTPSELLADLEAFLADAPLPSTMSGAVPLVHTRFNTSVSPHGRRCAWFLPSLALVLVIMILAATAILLWERAKTGKKNMARTYIPDISASRDASGTVAYPEQSTPSSQSGAASNAPFNPDKFQPEGEMGFPSAEVPDTDPLILELFEMEKAKARQAIDEKSGFKNAIENLNGLKGSLSGKNLKDAEALTASLEMEMKNAVGEFMRPFIADAAPLVEEGKLNDAVMLYSAAMRVHASEPEYKDAFREKISEIVAAYMEPFDREARPMIAGHEFDMAVNHYIGIRTGIRDNSLAPEFIDACSERIEEIRRFKDAVETADMAKNNPLGLGLAVEQLNGFRSSVLCAGEAVRLIGELEEARKNAPDSSGSAGEGGTQE
ncbi:MAG: serine/threonine protein kinase, partial [Clostridia bacterium]|nr:serine/threonine protein kinase [Clostridia bacterium]